MGLQAALSYRESFRAHMPRLPAIGSSADEDIQNSAQIRWVKTACSIQARPSRSIAVDILRHGAARLAEHWHVLQD